jgi:(E)-4-hydroxy-3-methylbut-2-enyl-diphosphate synthase
MANTLTSDIDLSVAQFIRIAEAGADYVRFTVPSMADADAFSLIKKALRARGHLTPLIADVHFNPEIALKVADYADKVRINPGNFSDKNKFYSLVEKCRVSGKAIRIGVNHGSLSQSVMDKFGDTPLGMAESAMEYLRICRELNFNQVVVSMKSSNVRVMIYATRLIADMMDKEDMPFPLHLGVTEAGEGEDGRIKSAVGIGTLLSEGLGDTIRVSLTEDPEAEIPVARSILRSISADMKDGRNKTIVHKEAGRFEFIKRKSMIAGNIGGGLPPVVYGYDRIDPVVRMLRSSFNELNDEFISDLSSRSDAVLVFTTGGSNVQAELKWLRNRLEECKCAVPVILRLITNENTEDDFMIKCSVSLGGTIIDGFGDGLWLENTNGTGKEKINSISLGILQACRARMSKTEFISCPSCGRTHFNLIDALSKIRKATGHLKGLKIGVMGCIVNGPGEMADADYGYVGSGIGKITLYKAKEIVKKGIPEDKAVEELIILIRENGDWIEPPG